MTGLTLSRVQVKVAFKYAKDKSVFRNNEFKSERVFINHNFVQFY